MLISCRAIIELALKLLRILSGIRDRGVSTTADIMTRKRALSISCSKASMHCLWHTDDSSLEIVSSSQYANSNVDSELTLSTYSDRHLATSSDFPKGFCFESVSVKTSFSVPPHTRTEGSSTTPTKEIWVPNEVKLDDDGLGIAASETDIPQHLMCSSSSEAHAFTAMVEERKASHRGRMSLNKNLGYRTNRYTVI